MTAALRRAIKLTEWTRVAFHGDPEMSDFDTLTRLMNIRDEACALLNLTDLSAYVKWCQPTLDKISGRK